MKTRFFRGIREDWGFKPKKTSIGEIWIFPGTTNKLGTAWTSG